MQHWRTRENRKSVRISVRVRTDDGWADATVRNVSKRGMMLHSLQPLRRNDFIEVTRGRHRVVGRVVWSEGAGCGLRTQDQIDIAGLLGKPQAPGDAGERRQAARVKVPVKPVRTHEEQARASRALGQSFERMMILVVGVALSTFAAGRAYEALAAPAETIQLALAGTP